MSDGRTISYSEFRRACSAYRPSELLPVLGQYSARTHGTAQLDSERLKTLPPWGFATIARECLLWGKDTPGRHVHENTVPGLFNLLRDVDDTADEPTLAELITPMFHDQFRFQADPFTDMARAIVILGPGWDGLPDWDWTPVFGLSLPDMVRATSVLLGIASGVGLGKVDLSGHWVPLVSTELAPLEDLTKALAYLTLTPEEHHADAVKAGVLDDSVGQYAYNPIQAHPFIDFGPDIGVVSPEPRLVWQAISLQNLYYVGPTYFGEKTFHQDLGKRIEAYVGRQLGLIEVAQITGEVPLDAQNKMSIDWFLVLPDLIVLVECKSARLNAKALAGDPYEIARATQTYLTKARDQIDKTAEKVRDHDRRVSFLPEDDRPIVGLIVTAEPMHMANSGTPEYGTQGDTPTMVLSLSDLERLVRVPTAELSARLAAMFDDPERRTWGFPQAFGLGAQGERNPIIREALNRSRFLRDDNGD